MINMGFVNRGYRSVTIPIMVIMGLTCGSSASTTFSGYPVRADLGQDQQA